MSPQHTLVEDEEIDRELRRHYLATAEERIRKVADAVEKVRAAPADAAAVTELCGLLHKIAGNAGAYGFPRISAAAKVAERKLLEAKLPLRAALIAEAVAFADGLAVALRAAKAAEESTQ